MADNNYNKSLLNSGDGQANRQRRRTRNDNHDRNFTCGCGKSYLSYPALYTHLKQKHDGKPPEGTSLPQNSSRSARGRPSKPKEDNDRNVQEQEKSNVSSDPNEVLDDLVNYIDSIAQNCKREEGGESSMNILNGNNSSNYEGKQIIEVFPIDFFTREDQYISLYQQILNLYQQSNNSLKEQESELGDKSRVSLNRIFATFLINLSKSLDPEPLRELIIFTCLYRYSLNLNGWEKLATESTELEESKEREFCDSFDGEKAFLFCNQFIVDFLPKYYQNNPQSKELQLIGPDDIQLKYTVFIVQHFSNWLYSNKFSSSKLMIDTSDN